MPLDLSRYSVAEIRDYFLGQENSISPYSLSRLQRDSREGVRKVYLQLKRRQEREKEERQRVESMLNLERVLWSSGVLNIAGTDEVGVGPLAGPLVAAAVVFSPNPFISGVDDSKRLGPEMRQQLARIIREEAVGIGIGLVEVAQVDQLNVYQAGILAMRRAVEELPNHPDHLLLDAREIPGLSIPQSKVSKGDSVSFSIAAASIIAKTYRDQLMVELDGLYPQYGFARNKGYCTPEHQKAIQKHGPSTIHRKSFTFIQELCGKYSDLFYRLREKTRRLASAKAIEGFEKEFLAARSQLSSRERRKIKLLLARYWNRAQLAEPR